MKSLLMAMAVLFATGSWAVAGPAHDVMVRADKLEKRVQTDFERGKISKDVSDKLTEQLTHIHDAMLGQASTTALRRGMKEEMDRMDAALTNYEQGRDPGADSIFPSPTP